MILLAVDVGNTNICFSYHNGSEWSKMTRIKTHSENWYEELKTKLASELFDDAVVSSVVPSYTQAVCDCIYGITNKSPLVISRNIKTGLKNIPEELGSDIMCNAIQGHTKYPEDYVTIADFGTAFTTVTVNPQGGIEGVTIGPGLLSSLKALFENTSQIPQIRLDMPQTVLGRDTISSVRAGVVYGFVGQLESIVNRIEKELNHEVKLLVTGGFSVYIAPFVNKVACADVNLTIDGARQAFEMNK